MVEIPDEFGIVMGGLHAGDGHALDIAVGEADVLDGGTFLLADHEDGDFAGGVDQGEGHGHAGARGGDGRAVDGGDPAIALVQGIAAGEKGGGVSVAAHAEQDVVESLVVGAVGQDVAEGEFVLGLAAGGRGGHGVDV